MAAVKESDIVRVREVLARLPISGQRQVNLDEAARQICYGAEWGKLAAKDLGSLPPVAAKVIGKRRKAVAYAVTVTAHFMFVWITGRPGIRTVTQTGHPSTPWKTIYTEDGEFGKFLDEIFKALGINAKGAGQAKGHQTLQRTFRLNPAILPADEKEVASLRDWLLNSIG
jgi:hypothetical protein